MHQVHEAARRLRCRRCEMAQPAQRSICSRFVCATIFAEQCRCITTNDAVWVSTPATPAVHRTGVGHLARRFQTHVPIVPVAQLGAIGCPKVWQLCPAPCGATKTRDSGRWSLLDLHGVLCRRLHVVRLCAAPSHRSRPQACVLACGTSGLCLCSAGSQDSPVWYVLAKSQHQVASVTRCAGQNLPCTCFHERQTQCL